MSPTQISKNERAFKLLKKSEILFQYSFHVCPSLILKGYLSFIFRYDQDTHNLYRFCGLQGLFAKTPTKGIEMNNIFIQ